jgi:hypothetical protein
MSGSSPANRDRAATSRFTYRHLAQLASYVATCPLRVIAHIDLDAFYAQCEMVRLQVDDEQPLVVQQWYFLLPSSLLHLFHERFFCWFFFMHRTLQSALGSLGLLCTSHPY